MLELRNIRKSFGEFAIDDVSLKVHEGDYFMLLGQSGSGKSVLLQIIAGLIKPDAGEFLLGGKDYTYKKIQDRQVVYLFQDYALFPHMSIFENIAFPLRNQRLSNALIHQKVESIASSFEIAHLLKKRPETLSGGEKQRVALARSLVVKPRVLLLDEPLSALDTQLRPQIRKLLRNINKQGQTILHITHDQEEAISLGNRVAVIHQGQLLQSGEIHEVFLYPKSNYIASFLGIRNFFNCTLIQNKDKKVVILPNEISFFLETEEQDGDGFAIIDADSVILSEKVPESSARNCFQGVIVEMVPYKNGYEVFVDIGIKMCSLVSRASFDRLGLLEGKKAWVSFKSNSVRFIRK
jgi:molybdopterin-binding protein